jgi:hypothetical protein
MSPFLPQVKARDLIRVVKLKTLRGILDDMRITPEKFKELL